MVDKYIGQTYGPAGMGMSAYSNIPDPIFSEPLTVSELGQTYGPAGMGMSAYMDRPGPMEMAAPPDNIGYDRMGPDLQPNFLDKPYKFNPKKEGLPAIEYRAGLKDWMKDKAWPWMKETGEGMKNQIPYLLDNLIPGYEPPEGYYEPDWEENKDMAGLEENDLYHLMRNGYTLEEAQEILNEQIGDGSFEVAEALTPDASFKILQGLADKSPEYFYKTLPMIYGDDLWDETPMFNYGGDFYGNSELSWG